MAEQAEQRENISENLLVTPGAFTAGYPTIPVPTDVDMGKLTEGDANPMFVTLPIMRVGATSRNVARVGGKVVNRRYGRGAAEALVRDVNRNRPKGLLGHPKPGDGSKHPAVIRWVAAELDDSGTAWGKFYVMPNRQDVRDDLRTAVAARAKMATSLWGSVGGVREDGEVIDLQTTRIDLVDADEAGIPDLGGVPHITKENYDNESEEGEIMPDNDLVNELRGQREQVSEQLTEARQQISEMQNRIAVLEQHEQTVTAIREIVGEGDLLAGVREMRTALDEMQRIQKRQAVSEAVEAALGDVANNERGAAIIREMVGEQADPDAAAARVKDLLGKDHIQAMLRAIVAEQAGGNVIIGASSGGSGDKLRDQQIENAESIAKKWGIN